MRYGYCCINLSIKDGSPNKRVTYKKLQTLSKDEQYKILYQKSKQNVDTFYRIIEWNSENNVSAYRISSDIFPLATHEAVIDWWEPTKIFAKELDDIGKLINKTDQFITIHPPQFTVLTSPNEEIIKRSFNDLNHHYKIMSSLNMKQITAINIHGGGKYGDSKAAVERFIKNWDKLPYEIREWITLENDQKIYNLDEILEINRLTHAPVVFDTAHWAWNKGSIKSIEQGLIESFKTWPANRVKKIHVSSQKPGTNRHAHADYIEENDIKPINNFATKYNEDFAVMLECKMKDKALLKLREDKVIK